MNNNEIILISDIHYGVHGSSEWVNNINEYFDNFFIPFVKGRVASGSNPIIFVLGDYFQDRVRLTLEIIHYGQQMMRKLSAICPVHMLVGNHDNYEKVNTEINSLNIFSDMENVTIYDKFTTIDVNGTIIDVMPWFGETRECMIAANKLIKKSNADLIFMHSDINGCSMDNGTAITDGVDSNAFKGTKIYSGHIHKRQHTKKVTYIGSPYHTSKSDVGNEKGIYILSCNGHNVEEYFYKNTFSPICVKVDVEDLYNNPDIKDVIENNYVYIVGHQTDNNIKLREFLHNYNLRKYEYVNKQVPITCDGVELTPEQEEALVYKDTAGIVSMIESAIDSMTDITDEEKAYLKEINKINFE